MAKFFGVIGYADLQETAPGVWEEVIVERKHFGDVIKNVKRNENAQTLNDNINISNRISIVADPYALNHVFALRYVEWCGSRWEVSSVEIDRPRLVLTIGGVYNGPTPETPDDPGESSWEP